MNAWKTSWKVPETVTLTSTQSDYRDVLPRRPEELAEQLAPIVQDGRWTLGLFECWGSRERLIKPAVHVPCCPSFRFNPFAWRGICFGRTLAECYWFGVDRTRWSRTVHALAMGREYSDPFQGLGKSYPSEIANLCMFVCCLGCAFGLGIGQAVSICGNYGVNFAACFTCHAREKMRRAFHLPAAFCLPPGIDDCCVHFFCMYCASHQEMREMVVRGLDGPGISPLDVHPSSWAHVEGFQAEMEHRQRRLAELQEEGVLFLPFEQRMTRDVKALRERHAARRSSASLSAKSTLTGLTGGAGRMDSGRVNLLDDGPAHAPWAGDVEMAMLPAHDDADLAAELAAVASTRPKAGKLTRSNSIVF